MAAVLAGLKSVDFYRKLKRDLQQELTEASIAGAALVCVRCLLACNAAVGAASSRQREGLGGRQMKEFHGMP